MTENKRAVGSEKERIAAAYLEEKGFRILEMNYSVRQAEADIIALDKRTLVFVEVRYRRTLNAGHPLETVTRAKQKQVSKAALFYMNQRKYNPETTDIRFDVVGILGDEIFHIKNAFPFCM